MGKDKDNGEEKNTIIDNNFDPLLIEENVDIHFIDGRLRVTGLTPGKSFLF